ncbi:hypothetical protein [Paenibacillus sp. JJ-223]|uniref:hypothetical protein n=1 Tax=Paenibacillus sp. JJ-223 TaxID=2905647 RepID=UPI001F177F08|nr:hypothetical protein [Paenibacillus sp. JJ-223]CAH1215978.1 hypothetical protein PAECIP111890_04327 [Paenibacillus sp. JJ-223]
MAKDYAKFMAVTGKKIVFGDEDVELKLTIPRKVAAQNLEFLTGSLNKEIQVLLGDPQASFDFEEEDDPMYQTWNGGGRVTTDASGVVTRIEGSGEEEKDENQAELFDADGTPLDQQEPNGDGADQTGEPSQEQTEGEGQQVSEEGAGEPSTDDLPDWMREDGGDKNGAPEMDFDGQDQGEQQPNGESQTDPEGNNEGGNDTNEGDSKSTQTEQDKLNQYIIANRPVIAEITLDVPAVIERKLSDTSLTWRDIANDMGMSSGKLMGVVSKYKAKVKEQMTANGVA